LQLVAVRAVRRSYKAWTDEVVPGEEKDIFHTPWFGDERAKKQISVLETRTMIL